MKKIIIMLSFLLMGAFCFSQEFKCYKLALVYLDSTHRMFSDTCNLKIYMKDLQIHVYNEPLSTYYLMDTSFTEKTKWFTKITYPAFDEESVRCHVAIVVWNDGDRTISAIYSNLHVMYYIKRIK